MKSKLLPLLAAVGLLCTTPLASAQTWPSHPIRWIVPLPAGTSPDVIARRIAPRLADKLGQPVLVLNMPGADHNLAMQAVARSEPDGYTLLHAVTSLVTNPHLYKLSFDPISDLQPVARIASTAWVLVARNDLGVNSIAELIALAKARPGRISCANTGGLPEIACRGFASLAGIQLLHVSYKGGPRALMDLMGGHVDIRFESSSGALPLARQGRLRALASLNRTRGGEDAGDLPTLAETYPGFEFVTWQGILVRSGTPPEIVAHLSAGLAAALAEEEVSHAITATGNIPAYASRLAFEEIIKKDLARYGKMIRELGIHAEP